jgi:hypothetical protein
MDCSQDTTKWEESIRVEIEAKYIEDASFSLKNTSNTGSMPYDGTVYYTVPPNMLCILD